MADETYPTDENPGRRGASIPGEGVPSPTHDEPAPPAAPDPPAGPENFDARENLTENDVDEVMQTGYDPPDREPHSLRRAPTAAEERAGPSTEERLAQEVPDVGEEETAGGMPDPRAGRLVAPDEGTQEHPADAPDEVASDRGPAGYASSAEEAAVHIVDPDEDT